MVNEEQIAYNKQNMLVRQREDGLDIFKQKELVSEDPEPQNNNSLPNEKPNTPPDFSESCLQSDKVIPRLQHKTHFKAVQDSKSQV